jgi:hypothetical protein
MEVTRATVFAYLQVLTAAAFLGSPAVTEWTDPLAAGRVGIALCLLAFAVSLVRTPEQVTRGTAPAPRWLLALAGVATLAALGLAISLLR